VGEGQKLDAVDGGDGAFDVGSKGIARAASSCRLASAGGREEAATLALHIFNAERGEGNNTVSMRSSARCRGAGGRAKKKGSVTFGRAARSRSLVVAAASERCGSRVSTGGGGQVRLRCGSVTSGRVSVGVEGASEGHGEATVHALVALLRSSIDMHIKLLNTIFTGCRNMKWVQSNYVLLL
jgi:hypothetical protein